MKIGIIGTAGTGKSSLARELSEALGVKCALSRAVTHSILVRDGYDYASGVQVERFLSHPDRQREILGKTLILHDASNDFITDRTYVDIAAYAIAEMHSMNEDTIREIYDTCLANVGVYSHLVFCEWCPDNLIDNGVRTLNPWYQFIIHSISKELCRIWGIEVITIPPGIKDRVSIVKSVLGG